MQYLSLTGEVEPRLMFHVLEQHYDLVWIRRLSDGHLALFGKGLARLWGCPAEEAPRNADTFHQSIHPADRALRMACWQSPATSANWELEYRVIHPTGEIHWVRETAFAICDTPGQPTHVVGLIRDITHYKLIGLVRRETEAQLYGFFEQNLLGCCLLSASSLRFTTVNAAFVRLTGYSVEDLIGRRPDDLNLWLDQTLPNLVFESLRQSSYGKQIETTLLTHQNDIRHVELTATALDVGDQRYIALLCRDITDAKQLQTQLADSEARFRALFMGLPDLVVHISHEGRVYDINHADFGYEKAQLIGRNFFDWFCEEDHPAVRMALAQALLAADSRCSFEARLRLPSGEVVWCAGQTAGVHFNQSAAEFLITLRDVASHKQAVTELHRLNTEISEANDSLRELDKLKARFAATLIHDLRSPLTCVYSVLELLDHPTLDEGLRHLLAISQNSLQRALDMIGSIQHIYQSEEGLLRLECAPIHPKTFIQPCWESTCIEGKKKNLHLALTYSFDTDQPLIFGDAPKLERAVSNLLTNAMKFTPPGGSVTVNVTVLNGSGVNIGRDFVEISILDTGIGIPPEDLPYVFDVYRQSRNNRTGVGFGLGLAIVKSIVAAHGGDVRVESQVSVGTSFSILLPVYVETPPTRTPGEPPGEPH